jgi:hypothetical protein
MSMRILQLHTGLFPDADTIVEALAGLASGDAVERIDISRPEMGEEDWDRVVEAVLASDRVITT